MSYVRDGSKRKNGRDRLVAVAVDKDKSSHRALKWAVENFITRGQTVKLVHVLQRQPSTNNPADSNPVGTDDNQISDIFLPFRCYCSRRQVHSEVVVLEDPDVAKALIEYVTQNGIETLLLGSTSKSGLSRFFKATDIPGSVLKWAPDFCNVYVVSKGKVGPVRTATRPVPIIKGDGLTGQPQNQNNNVQAPSIIDNDGMLHDELSAFDDHENDFAWASNGGSWSGSDSSISSLYENLLNVHNSKHSTSSNTRRSSLEFCSANSSSKLRDDVGTTSLECAEDANDETRRLRIELKQTMDMYHAACKEALAAKQKVIELQEWKRKKENKIREAEPEEEASTYSTSSTLETEQKARYPEEEASTSLSSLTLEKDRKLVKCKEAFEVAVTARRFIELEVQKRLDEERKELTRRLLYALDQSHIVATYQSLFHILLVVFIFYVYFTLL